MKASKYFRILLCIFCMYLLSIPAYATDNALVPYTEAASSTVVSQAPSVTPTQQAPSTTSKTEYYASNYADIDLLQPPTADSPAASASNAVVGIIAEFFRFVFQVAPYIFLASILVDVLCLLWHPVNVFFANVVPVRLFSKELSDITGVPFKARGNGSGDSATPPAATEPADSKGKTRIIAYMKNRGITCIFAFAMLVFTGTGIWFKVINVAVDSVIGAISSLLG